MKALSTASVAVDLYLHACCKALNDTHLPTLAPEMRIYLKVDLLGRGSTPNMQQSISGMSNQMDCALYNPPLTLLNSNAWALVPSVKQKHEITMYCNICLITQPTKKRIFFMPPNYCAENIVRDGESTIFLLTTTPCVMTIEETDLRCIKFLPLQRLERPSSQVDNSLYIMILSFKKPQVAVLWQLAHLQAPYWI